MRHFIEVRNKYLAVADPDIASDGDRQDIEKLARTTPI